MPGWHARTEPIRKKGEIKVLGIIQEQHPERCRLFMQWHQMDWPILVDSLNLLEVAAVPYTLLIDESGVIHAVNPSDAEFEAFISSNPQENGDVAKATFNFELPDWGKLQSNTVALNSASAWSKYAEALFLWGGDSRIQICVNAYKKAVSLAPDDGWLLFRLGVSYRRYFDLTQSNWDEFTKAIEAWQAALELDPNQYIWRRRIQQYGPRLDKPYSFYDWVNQAREDITDRGETPHPLRVEPGGAEFAYPANKTNAALNQPLEPDSKARVFRDTQPAIQIKSTVVSATYEDKKAWRVHLRFQPHSIYPFHWNNEAEPLSVWIHPSEGWRMDSPLIKAPNPPEAVDEAPRTLEFELIQEGENPPSEIKGYALYNICEEINGTCLFRRQDFIIPLNQP